MRKAGTKYEAPAETTRLLYESVRTARETEDIGDRTLQEMAYQRDLLEDTSTKVRFNYLSLCLNVCFVFNKAMTNP